MAFKTIEDIDVNGKCVLMRVDFNVPMSPSNTVADSFRIKQALPSIRSVIARGGRLVLMSHLGRPDGSGYVSKFSLKPIATELASLLGDSAPDGVFFPSEDCIDAQAAEAVASLKDGQIVLLENLRFHVGEMEDDATFASKLAAYGDIYCNDAFGACHRAHASVYGTPMGMQEDPRVAGLLVSEEIRYLREALNAPEHPFVAVIGGAKVSHKIGALKNLIGKVDSLLVGGAMAYTIMQVMGTNIGSSLVEHDKLSQAEEIIHLVDSSSTDLVLPIDHVCGRELSHESPVMVSQGEVPNGWMGLDIGPATTARFTDVVRHAKKVVWNGPLGAFETPPFDVGTRQLAVAMASCTESGGITVVGGGDTAAAVELAGVSSRMSHVSTGGGASLKLLEGGDLIGLQPLEQA
ncbi:MAG: phosphoglycerate kinase [Planctomycetes bacterium TMED75]|nr:phosphoglycerate kinase [Planctomycetaceae bacterium]OUU96084.1 MAG: phosphoglycerate kinase [Planctomycetes bacterium TMED75]